MNYTESELKELQKINTVTEQELGTRAVTPQDVEVFNQTVQELWEQGFAVTKNNFLKLWLAFDNSQVPITKPNILETVKVYRDQYDWKSADEMEFEKLSAALGPKTDLIWNYLGGHRLEKTVSNWLVCARFILRNGWGTDSRESFTRVLTQIQWAPQGTYGSLEWAPTPDDIRKQKEAEPKANTPLKKVSEEERNRAISHTDVTNSSDSRGIVRGIDPESPLGRHQASVHAAMQTKQNNDPRPETSEYFQHRVQEFIRNIPENVIRAEMEQAFSTPRNASWELTYRILENAYNRRKTERIMAGRMG